MTDESDFPSEDNSGSDSDKELQAAFQSGRLKPGLNAVYEGKKVHIVDKEGLERRTAEIRFETSDWSERLDLVGVEDGELQIPPETGNVDDDFKREMSFYRQAQQAVLVGIARLHRAGVRTRRPDDYLAEMAKSDQHMKRVREKLLEKQQLAEKRIRVRKLRDLKKFGKKVQQQVMLKRQKEKKQVLDAVKKYRKGQASTLDFLDGEDAPENHSDAIDRKKSSAAPGKSTVSKQTKKPGKTRRYKDKKFGFGGKKKFSKSNTRESTFESSEAPLRSQQKASKFRTNAGKKFQGGKGKKSKPQQRPGKMRRQKQRANK